MRTIVLNCGSPSAPRRSSGRKAVTHLAVFWRLTIGVWFKVGLVERVQDAVHVT